MSGCAALVSRAHGEIEYVRAIAFRTRWVGPLVPEGGNRISLPCHARALFPLGFLRCRFVVVYVRLCVRLPGHVLVTATSGATVGAPATGRTRRYARHISTK